MIPLKQGGTGSRSEFEEQPDFLPDRFESVTPNTVGIAGLRTGVQFVLEKGIEEILNRGIQLMEKLTDGLKEFPEIRLCGPQDGYRRTATASFNIASLSPSDVAFRLEREFGILCRPGLQCAPAAHRTIGIFPEGTLRFSLSHLNSMEQIDQALQAVARLVRG
jgi:cysteine desulfurase / selenocysteine lyase